MTIFAWLSANFTEQAALRQLRTWLPERHDGFSRYILRETIRYIRHRRNQR